MTETIKRFLAILDHDAAGGVTEVCVFQGGDVPTHAGYFGDHDAAANAIRANDGKGNVFVTLNPVRRDLLARGNNRLIEGSYKHKLKRTKDNETLCDSWFFLDIDAERLSGISSTDAELHAAIETGIAVRDWLIASGVPAAAMLTAKSGNGAYVLIRLPDYKITPERATIKAALLKYLADLFDTGLIKIDQSVKNEARLIGALGTFKVKGENIPERPHRRSSIGTVGGEKFDPAKDQRCEPFDLYALAEKILPKAEPTAKPMAKGTSQSATLNGQGIFNICDYLAGLGKSKEERGFSYHTCPGCRGDGKLYVNQATGAYGCFHFGAGTCSYEAIRAGLGQPKQKPKTPEEIEWVAPIPFNEYQLPAFPVDAFPVWLGDYVKALATATQVPIDAPATCVISVVSAAVSRRYRILVRGRWSEPLNTYTVVVLPPANRKSAVHDEVTKPLAEYEQDLIELERDWIAKARTEYKILEAKLERLRKDCAKADEKTYPKLKAQAEDVAAELAGKEYPVDRQLICDDVTPETLATLLAEQGGRMALFSAEGGIFEIMAGRYSKGSNFEVFLKGHAGDALRVNRRGRAEHINKPALTIGLTVQPEVIRGLANKPEFRGRGLLGRFFYSLPVSLIGRRDVAPEDVPQGIEAAYSQKVKALAELQPKSKDEPREITLAPSALAVLTEYARGVEIAMREGGGLAEFTDWAGKLVGGIARIAGLLHLAEHVGQPIPDQVSAETVRAACRIGDYFTAHARAAFAELGASQAIEAAKYVLRWIKRELPHRDQKLIYTKREIYRGCQTRFKTVDEIDPAINLLIAQDFLRELDTSDAYTSRSKSGRRPSARFALNPFTDFLSTIDTIDRIPTDEGNLSIVSIMQGGKESSFSGLVNGKIDQIAALTADSVELDGEEVEWTL